MENQVDIREELNKPLEDIFLADVMKTPPVYVQEDERFMNVEQKFRLKKIKHLLIVNREGVLVGLLTLQDLFQTQSPRKNPEDGSWFYTNEDLDKFILKYVMSQDLCTFPPDVKLIEAMFQMSERGFGCVPVVDEANKPIGIITQSDIIRVVSEIFRK